MSQTPTRRASRRQAFQTLFASLFQASEPQALTDSVRLMMESPEDPYCAQLVQGVMTHLPELDAMFEPHLSATWRKERLNKVSLVLLRLGLYEQFFMPDMPASVAINEAIELAKEYADPKEAAFVNGVLGSVYRAKTGAELSSVEVAAEEQV